MRPAELESVFGGLAGQQAIKESSRESISATHAVVDIQLGFRGIISLAIDPRRRAPGVPIGRVYFAQAGGYDLHLGIRFDSFVGSSNAQPLLQVFFIPHQYVDILDDAADHSRGAIAATPNIP